MSIDTVNERLMQDSGSLSIDDRKETRVFVVTTDSAGCNRSDIYAHDDIPNIFEKHLRDDDLWCTRIRPERYKDRSHWLVFVEYESKQGTEVRDYDPSKRPWDQHPQIRYFFVDEVDDLTLAYDVAAGGSSNDEQDSPSVRVVNSAGMPFDPGVSHRQSDLVIEIRRNEKDGDVNPADLVLFKDTMNEGKEKVAGFTIQKHRGRIVGLDIDQRWFKGEKRYWQVTYQIQVRHKSWGHAVKVLDQGFYEKFGDDDLRRIYESSINTEVDVDTEHDVPVTEPQKLNGSGRLLVSTDSAYSEGGIYKTFYPLYPKDWGPLKLPSSHKSSL